jgi:two-component system LytT family response regulator
MIDALIVDDERKSIEVLRKLLKEYCPDVNIVGDAARVMPAVQLIEKLHPHLIFLDIEMPGLSGFELLEKIRGKNIHVVFVSAYSEFALKAFRFSVVDYLLKPVGIDELKQAVEKVKALITAYAPELLLNKKSDSPQVQTLRIPSAEGVIFVYLENIIRVEAEGSYSHIYLDNRKHYMISDNLKSLSAYLELPVFVRIHRSHIINLKKIKSVISKQGIMVEMSDGSIIEVAKRNRADFMKIMKG